MLSTAMFVHIVAKLEIMNIYHGVYTFWCDYVKREEVVILKQAKTSVFSSYDES